MSNISCCPQGSHFRAFIILLLIIDTDVPLAIETKKNQYQNLEDSLFDYLMLLKIFGFPIRL